MKRFTKEELTSMNRDLEQERVLFPLSSLPQTLLSHAGVFMTFTVKIRSAIDPREHVRSIEADSSAGALKIALADFGRLYPACDARHVTVSVTKKGNAQ